MKLAILLPGYVESPDYRHLVVIGNKLESLGYTTIRVDACDLWKTGDGSKYTTTNYINQVKEIIESYLPQDPTEIILIGHSLGAFVSIYIGSVFPEVTRVVCLSLPIFLNNSDQKWVNGVRTSKKDLPNNPTQFRNFSVPYSYVEDRKQYSTLDSLRSLKKPFIIIVGDQDLSLVEVEKAVTDLKLNNLTKIKYMGHDFRQSEELCNQVSTEIEKFLKN